MWRTQVPTGTSAPGPKPQADEADPSTNDPFLTVFATSKAFTGSIGGITKADAVCNSLAAAANLPGTFRAWLSDSTKSPATDDAFTKSMMPHRMVDGTAVANSYAEMVNSQICCIHLISTKRAT